MTGICDVITAYKLTDVLSKATRLKRMQQVLVDGFQPDTPHNEPGMALSLMPWWQHPCSIHLATMCVEHYTKV